MAAAIAASSTGRPAASPSSTAPTAGPWLSPKNRHTDGISKVFFIYPSRFFYEWKNGDPGKFSPPSAPRTPPSQRGRPRPLWGGRGPQAGGGREPCRQMPFPHSIPNKAGSSVMGRLSARQQPRPGHLMTVIWSPRAFCHAACRPGPSPLLAPARVGRPSAR